MKNFAYTRAENVGAAIQSITQLQNARFLGGGTNLVDLMREKRMFQRCWSAMLSGCMRRRATPKPTE
jgi:hypothetical protein